MIYQLTLLGASLSRMSLLGLTFTKVAIENAIARASDDMKLTFLKPKQFEAVYLLMSGHDTFVSLPMGYGLSKAFDFLLGCTGNIAVVVSPLTSVMMDQREKFAPRNLSVEFLGEAQTDKDSIMMVIRGEVQLVFISPESLLNNPRYWNVLQKDVY